MHNIYEPTTKFNKIFMFLGNTITVVTGCICFISWIINLVSSHILGVSNSFTFKIKYLQCSSQNFGVKVV